MLFFLQPNDSGNAFLRLVKQEWMTQKTWSPGTNQADLDLRGFHGDYDLDVMYDGNKVLNKQFRVPKGQGTVQVTVQLQ